jgi:hypothetical protein
MSDDSRDRTPWFLVLLGLGPCPSDLSGFTRQRGRAVQS